MKKISLILSMGLLTAQVGFAQRGAVTTAKLELDNNVLDKAQAAIDKAAEHEKTKNDPKTWFYRGQIYQAMETSPLEAYKKLADMPVKVAVESYKKAIELDAKNKFTKDIEPKFEELYGIALQNAFQAYQDKNLNKALEFNKVMEDINPQDTTVFLHRAVFSEQNEDIKTAIVSYEKLLSLGYKSVEVHHQLINLARKENYDNGAVLKIVERARTQFPADKALMITEIQLYADANRTDELKVKLEEGLKVDPTNVTLYNSIGTIYFNEAFDEKNAKPVKDASREKAVTNFKKALELDKDNFDAAYNLGVIYFNLAADSNRQLLKMDSKTQNSAKGAKIEADIKKQLEMSLPYLETAYRINSKDPGILQTLAKTYSRLRKNNEAEKIMAELDAVSQ